MSNNDFIYWEKLRQDENGCVGSKRITLSFIWFLFKSFIKCKINGYALQLFALTDNENNYDFYLTTKNDK